MPTATKIIDHWSFMIMRRDEFMRPDTLKIYGDQANSKSEAKKLAKKICKDDGYIYVGFDYERPVYRD